MSEHLNKNKLEIEETKYSTLLPTLESFAKQHSLQHGFHIDPGTGCTYVMSMNNQFGTKTFLSAYIDESDSNNHSLVLYASVSASSRSLGRGPVRIKIKDIAAGAVLLTAIVATVVAVYIFGNKIFNTLL